MIQKIKDHPYLRLLNKRMLYVFFLGFSSGLPLALVGSTLEAWFATSGRTFTEIGIISMVGIPYTFKFIWAPLIDRYTWPFLGARRGWIIMTQLALLCAIAWMGQFDPIHTPWLLAGMAVIVAFLSASQDIVVDAYKAEILEHDERGFGASLAVAAYRIAMLVSSGGAMILADHIGWSQTYIVMAMLMGVGILTTLFAQEPKHPRSHPATLLEAVIEPLREFLSRPSSVYFLLIIVFYKFGDAFIAKMFTAFLLRGLSFSLTEVGSVLKVVGLATTIIGAITAGVMMARLSLYRALLFFGFCQGFSNLMFLWLSYMGHNFTAMVITVIVENFCSGLGNAAFVALLISLCDLRYTAFQYALFTAISAVPREFLGPVAGHLLDNVGWPTFFMITFLTSLPGLYFVWKAKEHLD